MVLAGLLALNVLGVIVLVAALAGSPIDEELSVSLTLLLMYLGLAILGVQFIRFIVTKQPPERILTRLTTRIRRSLVRDAAWLCLGTAYRTIGATEGLVFETVFGAGIAVYGSLLLIVHFRRHVRWRALRMRRELRGQSGGAA